MYVSRSPNMTGELKNKLTFIIVRKQKFQISTSKIDKKNTTSDAHSQNVRKKLFFFTLKMKIGRFHKK